ncbi:hypothetical protein ACM55I_06200 [Flavobacterium sp. GB2R13]|uniref:hypothetical protein n=1 Tax=Flavobacterium algoris TaxID=3398733 RepID=UPI003A8AC097
MEKLKKEVPLVSNSYCKVGKITAKKHFEEEQSITETEFEKLDENLPCIMI